MKRHFLAIAIAIATTLSLPSTVMASPEISSVTPTVQVANPFEDIPVVVGGVTLGTIDITRFVVRQGQLYARAVFTSVSGATENLLIPIAGFPTATCQILDLDLGAIHIDLLGLVIDLAPVHLDITAQPGAGNLLGNLLCAVANLLNPNPSGLVTQIAGLLNQILGAL